MPDYNFLIESRLSPEQLQLVNQLSRIAAVEGLNLYLAGGAVRDLTLGAASIRDLDFVVEGKVQKILRPLIAGSHPPPRTPHSPSGPQAAVEVVQSRLDERLQTAELVLAGGTRAEISMSRNEIYAAAGRRGEATPATIFDDLKRRDFSLNAMAISLHPNSRGLMLDPTNGVADLDRREIRVLHSRSFVEDPARLYRLLRLAHRLDLKTEERTKRWLDAALEERVWDSLGADAQARELAAILREDNPGRVLKLLRERGLLAGLDRKLGSTRIDFDRFEKVRSAARALPGADPYLLNFLGLVGKLPGGQRRRLAKLILGHAKTAQFALGLECDAKQLAATLGGAKAARPSQVHALLSGVPAPLLLFLLAHVSQAKVQARVKSFLFKFPAIRAALPRAELQAMGKEPGPKFEKVLERIFIDQLDGKLRSAVQVTKALRDYSGIKPPQPQESSPARRSKREAGAAHAPPAAEQAKVAAPVPKPGAVATKQAARQAAATPAPRSAARAAPPSRAKELQHAPNKAASRKALRPAARRVARPLRPGAFPKAKKPAARTGARNKKSR